MWDWLVRNKQFNEVWVKLYESLDWLRKRYVLEKKTIKQMAEEAGCSHMTIQRHLEKSGLIKNQRRWTK